MSTIRVSTQYDGKAKVATVDMDEEPGLAEIYHVKRPPCWVVFADGKKVSERSGQVGFAEMFGMLDKALEPAVPTPQSGYTAGNAPVA
jgi:thioredoxin-like negative regulator of GroEL